VRSYAVRCAAVAAGALAAGAEAVFSAPLPQPATAAASATTAPAAGRHAVTARGHRARR
jgi:hypothetical protein